MKRPLTLEMRGDEDYEIEIIVEGTIDLGDALEGTSEPAENDLSKEKTYGAGGNQRTSKERPQQGEDGRSWRELENRAMSWREPANK